MYVYNELERRVVNHLHSDGNNAYQTNARHDASNRFSWSPRNEEQSRRSSCGSQGTSDLSKVAFSNNHLRLTELPDLGGGRTAAKE